MLPKAPSSLLNVIYVGVLGLRVPEETGSTVFADNLALMIVAKHFENVDLYENKTVDATKA